jgi:hypothetical protein
MERNIFVFAVQVCVYSKEYIYEQFNAEKATFY